MEDTDIEDDPNANRQLTENFFVKSEHVFNIGSTDKKNWQYHRHCSEKH